ncbi:myelin protein zero-like protein 1 isoform 2-T2 [Vipera latastei]
MGGKGDGSRKMAAALAAAALAALSGSGGSRQGAAPTASFPALLLLLLQLAVLSSLQVISSSASVTWSFQSEGSLSPVSFFYYSNGKAYPGKSTQFDDRSSWAGDLNKKDASITIANMQFQDNGTYICDVKNPPDIVVTPGKIKVRVMEKGNLTVVPLPLVFGITGVGILVLVFVIMLIVCVMIRKKNSKKHYSGCSTSESLMSPVKQAPRKSPSDTEVLVNSVPIRSHQGPVIYAQLDHSGGHCSDKINKSESVVYADIRKN